MSQKSDRTRAGGVRRMTAMALSTATAVMAASTGLAFAQSGDTTTTTTTTEAGDATVPTTTTTASETQTTQASGGGTSTSGGGSDGSLKLKDEAALPSKVFFYGKDKATYRFTLSGDRARNLKIQAVNRKSWRVAKVWRRDDVEPGTHKVRWAGNDRHGKAANKGTYLFRVRTKRGKEIDRSRTKGADRSFKLFPDKFPVRARHDYGDGFGAPRSGHTHQGQDVFAKCGKRVVAARGGRVQYSGYQSGGAGYYVVIDGKSTGRDYVYMHLQKRDRVRKGRVRTGKVIGRVGHTGAASGCHLHFELWSKPGWYQGGNAMRSVTKRLKKWDRWS